VSVNGTDPNAIRNAPAGVSVLVFMDLEGIRPDQLQSGAGANLPGCVQSSAVAGGTAYPFNNCTAANTGVLTGTVTVTGPVPGTGSAVTYTEAFNLAVTTTLANNATQTWTYTGNQLVTISGTTAKVTLANPAAPIQAAFADSATPANDVSYLFTPNNLTEDMSDPTRLALSGGYELVGSNGNTITCTIPPADPLVWTPAGPCKDVPASGSLTLNLSNPPVTDQTTASFDYGCGNLNINGVTIELGGS
jgi:hypothetical protein